MSIENLGKLYVVGISRNFKMLVKGPYVRMEQATIAIHEMESNRATRVDCHVAESRIEAASNAAYSWTA